MQLPVFPPESKCLVKKYLTDSRFHDLKDLSTESGFTLEKAIQSGITNADSEIGIYLGDAESYTTFAPLLLPIIMEYHEVDEKVRQASSIHPVDLPELDPEGKHILSTRVRVARNIAGFSFTPHIESDRRAILEEKISGRLMVLHNVLLGQYYSMDKLPHDKVTFLSNNNLLFQKGDRFQEAGGINREFPRNRGIYISSDQRLRIWVNEEDHLRIICQDNSADLAQIFNHFCRVHEILALNLEFSRSEKYGYLTSCPTNIGTSMRAGVHIRLKKLGYDRKILDDLASRYNLQIRGTRGEKTAVEDNIFDLSNRQRFGISEVEIIQTLHQGITAILDEEKQM